MTPPGRNRDQFWALAAVGAVAVVAVAMGLLRFADEIDAASARRESVVVQNGLAARIDAIEANAVAIAVWDDAVRNLDNAFDPNWARDNVGEYYALQAGFSFSAVMDAEDTTIFAARGKTPVDAAQAKDLSDAARYAVYIVRALESRRQRDAHAPEFGLAEPLQFSTPRWLGGELYMVTATLVQPDFGTARLRNARAPIIVTGHLLSAQVAEQFARQYLLDDFRVHEGKDRGGPSLAHAALDDEFGRPIAVFEWSPKTPGADLLKTLMPGVLVLIVVLLTTTLTLYARARRAAHQRQVSEERALYMAYHDALTGIHNRAFFEDQLQRLAGEGLGRRFAVHCVDLDRFKELNDTYGHQAGDEILRETAARLAALAREGDLCARLGGDEFAFLQVPHEEGDIERLAQGIIDVFADPIRLGIGPKRLGCSVGVALSTDHTDEPLDILRRADIALYAAKAEGRGRFRYFTAAMDAELRRERKLKEDLAADLAADRLRMVYQPQVNRAGEIVGLEALVRWTHKELGPISPAVFVPLAEESGLILALGEFALRRAAQDSRRWPGLKVAVNVSAVQIQASDFVERTVATVKAAGVEASAIELEITEGVLLSHDDDIATALAGVKAAGFSIALDDFGTGYSSLGYLRRFPIDKIKIDRSFVTALGSDRKADALFASIVHLAAALEMDVIAEGVETSAQLTLLTAAGCRRIQGYIASRPLEANDVKAFLSRGPASLGNASYAA